MRKLALWSNRYDTFIPAENAAFPAELRDDGRLMEELARSYEPVDCKLQLWNSQVFVP
jgi:hypothetical protein